MKTKCLMFLLIAISISISLAGCSSDDDNVGGVDKALIGEWYRESVTNGKKTFWEIYTFYSNGRGTIENSAGNSAEFTYDTKHEGLINYAIAWTYASGGYYHDKYAWNYRIKGDELYLDDKKFTRRK